MFKLARWLTPLFVTTLLLVTGGNAGAERVRFHYVPAGPGCNLQLQPAACGGAGERVGLRGDTRGPFCEQPRPNCCKSFTHACTGQAVTVPLALPCDTPLIQHVRNRI